MYHATGSCSKLKAIPSYFRISCELRNGGSPQSILISILRASLLTIVIGATLSARIAFASEGDLMPVSKRELQQRCNLYLKRVMPKLATVRLDKQYAGDKHGLWKYSEDTYLEVITDFDRKGKDGSPLLLLVELSGTDREQQVFWTLVHALLFACEPGASETDRESAIKRIQRNQPPDRTVGPTWWSELYFRKCYLHYLKYTATRNRGMIEQLDFSLEAK